MEKKTYIQPLLQVIECNAGKQILAASVVQGDIGNVKIGIGNDPEDQINDKWQVW